MIVVVILGITAAIAVPMIGDRADLKLAAAARKAVADLQYAQSLSIATRDPVYVRFDADAYTLCQRSGTTLATIAHPVEQMPFVVRFGATPTTSALRGVTQAKPSFSGRNVVGFDALGAPFLYDETSKLRTSMTASGTVTLRCGGQAQALRIEPYTGEISIP